jgi:hypothetical protein
MLCAVALAGELAGKVLLLDAFRLDVANYLRPFGVVIRTD